MTVTKKVIRRIYRDWRNRKERQLSWYKWLENNGIEINKNKPAAHEYLVVDEKKYMWLLMRWS